MATITVRNLDDKIVDRLKQIAARNKRSLEAEVRDLLERSVEPMSRDKLLRLARRIRAMTPDVSQSDGTELIREDRNSDHGRDP